MTKDESDMILAYYDAAPDEIAAMKREIGNTHPVWRYVEALELARKYADSDYAAMTEEEEERLRRMSSKAARRVRGEG